MENPEYLLIERRTARVALEGPPDLLRQIAQRSRRYYKVQTIPAVPEGVWRVHCGGAEDGFAQWNLYESVVRSEPIRKVRYDLERKVVAVVTDDSQWLLVFSCRLLRDLLRWQLFAAHTLFFQAGLVRLGETGIALAGPPRVGKTTTALALVGCEGAQFVADNDLCIIDERLREGLGWPRSVCIRRDTLPVLEKWWPEFKARSDVFQHPNNRSPTGATPDFLHLLPSELSEFSRSAVLAQAPVCAFIFPEFTDEHDVSPRLTEISRHEAVTRLIEIWDFLPERKVGQRTCDAFQGKRTWTSMCFNPFLAEAFSIPDPEELLSRVRQLSSIPCYRLTQGLRDVQKSARVIADEVAQRARRVHENLCAIVAEIPYGAPENVVGTVTENRRSRSRVTDLRRNRRHTPRIRPEALA